MYQIISLLLAAVGAVLFFAPEYILQKDSTNATLKMIREYHQMTGVALLGGAYYLYTYKPETKTVTETSSTSEASVESATPPSYEEATSEA